MWSGNLRRAATDSQTFMRLPLTSTERFCKFAYLRVLVMPVVFLPTPPSALALPFRMTELMTKLDLPVKKHFFAIRVLLDVRAEVPTPESCNPSSLQGYRGFSRDSHPIKGTFPTGKAFPARVYRAHPAAIWKCQ